MNPNRLLLLVAAALFLIATLIGFGVFTGAHLLGFIAAGLLSATVAKLV